MATVTETPLWMTYPADGSDRTPIQRAALDAINCLPILVRDGAADGLTTAEVATFIGAEVESVWLALTWIPELATAHWPRGIPREARPCMYSEEAPVAFRPQIMWSYAVEQNDVDDDMWFAWRIEEAARLRQPEAGRRWAAEFAAQCGAAGLTDGEADALSRVFGDPTGGRR